eukprot:scaffold73_cov252-Pinguiococcus_pyrenoidosus.AAC.16
MDRFVEPAVALEASTRRITLDFPSRSFPAPAPDGGRSRVSRGGHQKSRSCASTPMKRIQELAQDLLAKVLERKRRSVEQFGHQCASKRGELHHFRLGEVVKRRLDHAAKLAFGEVPSSEQRHHMYTQFRESERRQALQIPERQLRQRLRHEQAAIRRVSGAQRAGEGHRRTLASGAHISHPTKGGFQRRSSFKCADFRRGSL